MKRATEIDIGRTLGLTMKLAFIGIDINPPWVGGVITSVLALAKAFNNKGADVHILTNKSLIPRGKTVPSSINFHDVGILPGARSICGSTSFFLDLVRKVSFLKKEYGIDIISSHSGFPSLAIATGMTSKLAGVTSLHTVYSFTNRIFHFKLIDKLLAISNNIYNGLIKHFSNTYYVGNGVDVNKFTSSKKHSKSALLGTDEKIIFHPGGANQEWRGIDTLIKAFAIVKREIDAKLLLAVLYEEKTPYLKELMSLAYRLNLEADIKWLGVLQCIEDFYCASDVVVLPLKNIYGTADIPNSILEAYACGTPVVASKVGGIPEVVNEKYLVPVNKPRELAMKIVEVLNDPPESVKFRKIAERFSWDIIADRYMEIINEAR